MEHLKDYELVQKALEGNQEAFGLLLSRYKNLVYSVILRMVNDGEEANDLAQEVFIKVYKNLDKYHPEYKFSTWLIRISTNHVIDYRRRKKHNTISIDDMTVEIAEAATPETQFLKKEEQNRLAGVVSVLPEIYRIPIVLYHQEGLKYREIADVLGEPLSKVKNRIFRGRKQLKELLEQEGW